MGFQIFLTKNPAIYIQDTKIPLKLKALDHELLCSVARLGNIYTKILGIFEGDGIFLGIYFFEKNLGINLGNYRSCSGKFLLSLVWYCLLLIFLIS